MSAWPETREGMAAAQAAYAKRREVEGFLSRTPDSARDGFEISQGKVYVNETGARLKFGEWQETEFDRTDSDVVILRAIHTQAQSRWRDMIDTVQAIRTDDDPSLNADGRLKIAARMLSPKLDETESLYMRESERIDGVIAAEEGKVEAAIRSTDPLAIAGAGEIRNYFRSLPDDKRSKALSTAIREGDTETLRALATMPAYLSGLTHDQQRKARERAAVLIAPERVAKIAALRNGQILAENAVREYGKRVRGLIDFKRAEALNEREAQRKAKHG